MEKENIKKGNLKMEDKKKKIKNIIRNVFGGLFIITGLTGMSSESLLAGIFMILFGVSLFPMFYKKTNLNFKHIQIILPLILMILSAMTMPEDTREANNNTNEIVTNAVQENKNIKITSLNFNESEIELDIKESKDIILEINPENANIDNLEYCSSDEKIATLEKKTIDNNENKITLKISPISEGDCEIFVKSTNGIESNKVKVKIIDNERIEKEQKEAEEAKRQEEAKKQEENKPAINTENASTSTKYESNLQSTPTNQNPTSSSSQNNSNNSNGKIIYRTPSGKRYHYDPDCGGKNSYQTTLNEAISAGLTPCQKCAK